MSQILLEAFDWSFVLKTECALPYSLHQHRFHDRPLDLGSLHDLLELLLGLLRVITIELIHHHQEEGRDGHLAVLNRLQEIGVSREPVEYWLSV